MTDHDVDMRDRADHETAQLPRCGCGEPVHDPNLCEFCTEPMCSSCEEWVLDVGRVCPKCKVELE